MNAPDRDVMIDWELARRTAARVASRREVLAPGPDIAALEPDFAELTAEAEELVAEATGLRSLAGPARGVVVDRSRWVEVNLVSFRRLLRPVLAKLTERVAERSDKGVPPFARKLTGMELGALLGWMSGRVLGQYDLLVIEEENPQDQDLVYYVGPNVVSLERRFGFPRREFRLWIALHEVTHRAQFTGVPWLRPHFLSLVHEALGSVEPDPKRFVEALKRVASAARSGRSALEDGGLVGLLATEEQRRRLDQISGLMSLLEGHGDVTMDRAGRDRVPNAARFAQVLKERRKNQAALAKVVQRLVGLEAKLAQYEQGERFIAAVEAASGGRELFDLVWTGPEMLPTLAEIRDPERWLARARAHAA